MMSFLTLPAKAHKATRVMTLSEWPTPQRVLGKRSLLAQTMLCLFLDLGRQITIMGNFQSCGLHWPSLAFIGLHWPSLAFIGLHWPSLAFIGLHLPSFAFNRVICRDSSSLLVVAFRCFPCCFVPSPFSIYFLFLFSISSENG
jgi:hypothetical protein